MSLDVYFYAGLPVLIYTGLSLGGDRLVRTNAVGAVDEFCSRLFEASRNQLAGLRDAVGDRFSTPFEA